MAHPLEQLRDDALREIESASDEQTLEAARVKYLGRSGSVSAWGEQMKTLGKEEKPIVGKLLNEVRNAVTAAIESRTLQFRTQKETPRSQDRHLTSGTTREMARFIPSPKCGNVRSKFSGEWDSRSRTARTSKTSGIVSTR
jgi:phenylalanyl-tRNA synthetase alpha subunit